MPKLFSKIKTVNLEHPIKEKSGRTCLHITILQTKYLKPRFNIM